MKTPPTEINPLIIEHAGCKVAAILADNEDRWNELYDFLGVVRIAQTVGFSLVQNDCQDDRLVRKQIDPVSVSS